MPSQLPSVVVTTVVTAYVARSIARIGALLPQFTKTQRLLYPSKTIPLGVFGNEVATGAKVCDAM